MKKNIYVRGARYMYGGYRLLPAWVITVPINIRLEVAFGAWGVRGCSLLLDLFRVMACGYPGQSQMKRANYCRRKHSLFWVSYFSFADLVNARCRSPLMQTHRILQLYE